MTRVCIVGSGVAAVEAALALDALAGDRIELELLAPAAELQERPWSVLTPFGADQAPRIDLTRLVSELDVRWYRDKLEAVEADTHTSFTREGERLHYELLIVAAGAPSREAVPGALTFRGPLSAGVVENVLDRAARDQELRLVFTAPAGVAWPLPLYELALMSSAQPVPGIRRGDGRGARGPRDHTPTSALSATITAAPADRADGLRRTREDRRPELPRRGETGLLHRDRGGGPLGDVLQRDREQDAC